MANHTCSLKQLAHHVKRMKEDGNSTAILIGAGAEELISKHSEEYDIKQYQGQPNAYNKVMGMA